MLCHRVERIAELAELIVRIDCAVIDAQVAFCELIGMRLEYSNGFCNAVREDAADAKDQDDAENRHDSKCDLHRAHLAVDDALRHGERHDPVRAADRRVCDDIRRAADIREEEALSILLHLVKVRADGIDF